MRYFVIYETLKDNKVKYIAFPCKDRKQANSCMNEYRKKRPILIYKSLEESDKQFQDRVKHIINLLEISYNG